MTTAERTLLVAIAKRLQIMPTVPQDSMPWVMPQPSLIVALKAVEEEK